MSISNTVSVLRRTMAFSCLGDDRLNVLAFSGERLRFSAGETILGPGEEPARCVVVIEGAVDLAARGGGSDEGAGPGTTIGEMALISNNPIDITVTGRTDGEVLVIDRPLLERMAEDFPDMMAQLREAMRGRLAETLTDLIGIESQLRRPGGARQGQSGPAPGHGRTGDPSRAPRRPR